MVGEISHPADIALPSTTLGRSPVVLPKYQVFVSSTFVDLRDERQAVTWDILKAGHIPAGMENFSACDDRGWSAIERAIDSSDYYVLILAGRYGSIDETSGLSWTHREYRHAVDKRIPILAFVRETGSISGLNMDTGDKADKLRGLIKEVSDKHHREPWTTAEDLRGKVSMALMKAIQQDQAEGRSRPGWYRGDQLPPPSAATLDEIVRLSMENHDLRARLDVLSKRAEPVFVLLRADRERGGSLQAIRARRPSLTLRKETQAPDRKPRDSIMEAIVVDMLHNDSEIARRLASARQMKPVLWESARTYVLRLALRNVGQSVARNVTIRFAIDGVDEVTAVMATDTSTRIGGSEIAKIEVKDRRGLIEQHVPLIGLSMGEALQPFRFRVAASEGAQWKVNVRFEVESHDGGAMSGAFSVERQDANLIVSKERLRELARSVRDG